jgi:kynureninase
MTHLTHLTRHILTQRDLDDPLAPVRDQFDIPPDVIYLDGNSLGVLPKRAVRRMYEVVTIEWGQRLIRSWNQSGWMELPVRIGDKIARLIGANAGEVVVTDSTSINVFKTLAAALTMRPDRRVILSTPDNFPTDLYMMQGLIQQLGGKHELRLVDGSDIAQAIAEDVAVVTLTHVNYRTGQMYDMRAITQAAHAQGALTMWDLAHSAGAVPTDLNAVRADFAVGCGYKYLNGGPGAPAFLFVAARHQAQFQQPLSGWIGHAQPFAFDTQYVPAEGISRYLCGTPPVLSMAALECGVDIFAAVDLHQLRAKSLALTDVFIALVESRCADYGLVLATPHAHVQRGSQVSFHHPDGHAIMQALIARGVIGDFRAPDILRFGFTPLYVRFVDVWDAVEVLRDILKTRAWDTPEFRTRHKVT